MPSFSLTDKVAIVTGASSGIGAHFAGVLAGAGAKVALLARRKSRAEEVAARVAANGSTVAFEADVTDRESIARALRDIEAEFGPADILINNAGVHAGAMAMDLKPEDWDATMDTNLKGAWLMTQLTAQRWTANQRPGVVVNIASILGIGIGRGVMSYGVSKAALIHMTKTLAREWARYDIRVNALAPGYFPTELTRDFLASPAGQTMVKSIPQRRIGNLEDLDGPLLLLASSASSYMTGSVIVVDGGQVLSGL
jgi:NAD(P)-dependent dehydrogenase (short-subunit alcohol dehydrogenase family)